MSNRIKPLSLEETKLKEEMKERCLTKGQYIDEKAKDKFNMLCHLEDFEIQYFNLLQENKELHNKIDKAIKRIELLGKFDGEHCTRNFKMMSADFNYLLEILKESEVDECE